MPTFPGRSLVLLAVLSLVTISARADDIEHGRNMFKLCEGCHSLVAGEHRYGPSLAGIAGRRAGQLKGYVFSDPLSKVRFNWDADHLTTWLNDEPKNMVPGTRMEFPGITDLADVKALVAYLGTIKK
jgi:cytochrome c